MGKSGNKNNNKKKRKKKTTTTSNSISKASHDAVNHTNFVAEAGPGCYIARPPENASTSWVLEWENVCVDDYDPDELEAIPELALDPQARTLSVCNMSNDTLIAYISVLGETPVMGKNGQRLRAGSTTNNEGITQACVTFIVTCPPRVFCHLCTLEVKDGVDIFQQVHLESDVQPWNKHPNPQDFHNLPLGFPLQSNDVQPSFLCTQGIDGQLTHFFSGNLHAIDFQCPNGTPLLAVGDGIVVESQDANTLTGIATSNLFTWNTILLKMDTTTTNDDDDPLYCEYVHISKSHVQKGDRVTRGQVIGLSGSVGFSPEPHLHFAAYKSAAPDAPTVRVQFQKSDGNSSSKDGMKELFLPVAGKYYNEWGEQPPKPKPTTTTTTTTNVKD